MKKSPPIDLSQSLDDKPLAGVVTDENNCLEYWLRENSSQIYNNKTQFIIQQLGMTAPSLEYGGGLIDADIIGKRLAWI